MNRCPNCPFADCGEECPFSPPSDPKDRAEYDRVAKAWRDSWGDVSPFQMATMTGLAMRYKGPDHA